MAAHGARRLSEMAANVDAILAIELLAAGQGCDFHRGLKSSAAIECVRSVLRTTVPTLDEDRHMAPDIAAAQEMVRSGKLVELVGDLPGLTT